MLLLRTRKGKRTIQNIKRSDKAGNGNSVSSGWWLEDIWFNIIRLLPERMIHKGILEWMYRYVEKRICQVQQEQIKANWKLSDLEKTVEKLQEK